MTVTMRYSLRALLIALAAVPVVIAGIVWWLRGDEGIDIELHFSKEPLSGEHVVFQIDKKHGEWPRRINTNTYRLDVPDSGHMTIASAEVFHRWHRLFIVTPAQPARRRAFEGQNSRWKSAIVTRRTPGMVESRSVEDGSMYDVQLMLQ